MRLVVQRVKHASVAIDHKIHAQINKGLLVLVGITHNDTHTTTDYCLQKLLNLRIFSDENSKMNLSLKQIEGELLLISQFTLYGNCQKGCRPSFVQAAPPSIAEPLYDYMVQQLTGFHTKVKTGVFGADMQVTIINDGPITIIIEK
jgi:D-aminoacyl-tRNA deacylase